METQIYIMLKRRKFNFCPLRLRRQEKSNCGNRRIYFCFRSYSFMWGVTVFRFTQHLIHYQTIKFTKNDESHRAFLFAIFVLRIFLQAIFYPVCYEEVFILKEFQFVTVSFYVGEEFGIIFLKEMYHISATLKMLCRI